MKPIHPPVKPGNLYGSLTVLLLVGKDKYARKEWRCKCACGTYRSAYDYELKRGACIQCAECGNKARAEKLRGRASSKRIDMKGRIFGRLTVIEFARTENHHAMWRCRCLCGNIKEFSAVGLRQDYHYSCGCYRRGQDVQRDPRPPKKHKHKPRIPEGKAIEPEPEPVAVPTDNRAALIVAARRTFTPWPDVAELVGMTVEECKAAIQPKQAA